MRKLGLYSQALILLFLAGSLVYFLDNVNETKPPLGRSPVQQFPLAIGTVTVAKDQSTSEGSILIPTEGNATVQLIDLEGRLLHSWEVDAVRARLLPNGHLLVIHGTKWGAEIEKWRKLRSVVREYDWNGDVVWEYRAKELLHHDLQRLPNGHTLILKRMEVPEGMYGKIRDQRRKQESIRSDTVVELSSTGEVLWEWNAHDHLDLNSCGRKGCVPMKGKANALQAMRDWTHVNTLTVLPENHWYSSGHEAFRPGNLMILPRNWWTAFIIDRRTGAIVWEYTGDYRGGLSGGHEAHMIPPEFPGAGNVLLFDNGRKVHQGESFVLEINPVTKKVVWVYDVGEKLFSPARGSVQRMANGNTLISEDKAGRCFEVTPSGKIVWEFRVDYELNRCRKYPPAYLSIDTPHS